MATTRAGTLLQLVRHSPGGSSGGVLSPTPYRLAVLETNTTCNHQPHRNLCSYHRHSAWRTVSGHDLNSRTCASQVISNGAFLRPSRRALFTGTPRAATATSPVTWWECGRHGNPLDGLQEFVQVPVGEVVYTPTHQELGDADKVFHASDSRKIQPMKGVINFEDLQDYHVPEVAFIGRSNCGKSSLIKSLFFHPKDVNISVSKRPGHTFVVKVYKLGRVLSLVDMPGYGEYMPDHFQQSVEQYILHRQRLAQLFVLIDGSVGLSSYDETALMMLEEFGKPYTLVMTKIDADLQSQVLRRYLALRDLQQQHLHGSLPQIFLASAHADAGLCLLRSFITHVTGTNHDRNRM